MILQRNETKAKFLKENMTIYGWWEYRLGCVLAMEISVDVAPKAKKRAK